MSEVYEKVKEIIVEQLDISEDKISPEVSLSNDIGADSLDNVEIMMQLEETFDVEVPEEVAASMNTVQDIVNYIEANK